jgi:hypothetical protein
MRVHAAAGTRMCTEVPMSVPTTPTPRPSDRGPFDRAVWPYLLIGAGVLLLLVNVGWLSLFTLGSLFAAWPVVLIAVGADLLTGGRWRRPIVVAAAVVVLLWWWLVPRGTATAATVDVGHRLDGARSAEIVLRLGVGEAEIEADADAGTLVAGSILTAPGEAIAQSESNVGGTARVEIAARSSGSVSVMGGDRRRWDLSITREVPLDLRIQAGVGRAEIDLRDARLSSFTYTAGVGETIVELSERGGYRAELDLGVGATTVRIPQEVEARVTIRTGLGRANVAGTFDRSGDVYTTPGYANAAPSDRIELSVRGGVGAVTVQRVR